MALGTEHKEDTHVTQSPSGTLVDALETIRHRDGLSVPAFADRLGISYAMMSAIRRGDRQPGPKTLRAIMQTLPETLLVVLGYMSGNGRPRRQVPQGAVDSGEGDFTSRPPQRSE